MTLRELTGATAKKMRCNQMYDNVHGVMMRHEKEGFAQRQAANNDYRDEVWEAVLPYEKVRESRKRKVEMETLNIIPDLTRQAMRDETYHVVEYAGPVTIGAMPDGTENGKPVVMIGIDIPDGDVLIIQTTLALFLSAADALKARHGDPR